MGMRAYEAAILDELRTVEKRRSIKQRDILAWQIGTPLERKDADEIHVYLPLNNVWVCYKRPAKAKA